MPTTAETSARLEREEECVAQEKPDDGLYYERGVNGGMAKGGSVLVVQGGISCFYFLFFLSKNSFGTMSLHFTKAGNKNGLNLVNCILKKIVSGRGFGAIGNYRT